MNKPEVLRVGFLQMQVCVPRDYSNEAVEQFANGHTPTGIDSKWTIRFETPVRARCEERTGCVHLVLTC